MSNLIKPLSTSPSATPRQRAWQRFKANRLGYFSLVIFSVLVLLSLCAELVSNDRPLIAHYAGKTYFPLVQEYPETTFGGDFETPTDYLDPFIRAQFAKDGNWALFASNHYGAKTLNYFAKEPNPSKPSAENWLGTDDRGRDLLAQLIYGFRVSVLFALALTAIGTVIGIITGAVQGYFGAKIDLAGQRFIEIWSAMPELYLLIIFSAVFSPSIALLLILLSLFGWMGLSDYVRAEVLRNKQLDYVRAARALGAGHWQIIKRHILPNSMTPVVTFLPFRMSGAILALTSLDFLGLGVPPGTPSLGELLSQGKNNIDAWWISLSAFAVLVLTMLLLTFMGDALRDALDPRKAMKNNGAKNKSGSMTESDPRKALENSSAKRKAGQAAQAAIGTSADAAPAAGQTSPQDVNALLSVQDLSIAFSGNEVVHEVDFAIQPGEKLALVGESGSGKSVTALALLGLNLQAQTSGSIVFEGQDVLHMDERQLRALRGEQIAMIFQEPMTALNPLLTIGEQIAEVLQLKNGLDAKCAWQKTIDLLSEVDIAEPARRAAQYPHNLSGGQRQRAMIAMALACQPKLLIADEPTTALDVNLREQMLELIDALCAKRGMAVLLITHDLNLVRRFASRVLVMQNGYLVEAGAVDAIFSNPKEAYTQQLIASRPVRDVDESSVAVDAAMVLSAKALRVTYPVPLGGFQGWFKKGAFVAVDGVQFQLAKGRTLGVIGESGSGKSTLALAALHLLPKSQVSGELKPELHDALRKYLQVVFQDPFSSLSPRMTIEEIVGEGLRIHAPQLSQAERQSQVLASLAEVGLNAEDYPQLLQRYPHEFSGGQRQRIAIARALILQPEVLVLDEPTSALDVTIQKQVIALLQKIQRERGISYLLITHDVAVVRAMAHDVMVMKDGRVVEQGSYRAVFDAPQNSYTQQLVRSQLA